ncbi:MAG: hypothetical protein ACOH1N_08185 [Lutibacter sp.]
MNRVFEQHFINDSYACPKGKGTHFGISSVDGFEVTITVMNWL